MSERFEKETLAKYISDTDWDNAITKEEWDEYYPGTNGSEGLLVKLSYDRLMQIARETLIGAGPLEDLLEFYSKCIRPDQKIIDLITFLIEEWKENNEEA